MLVILYDSAGHLDTVRPTLQLVGMVCVSAVSVTHLRQLLDNDQPSAIISSADLPEVQLLCQVTQAAGVPLYLVSQQQSGMRRVHALRMGAHQYYIAPFSHVQLVHDLGATRYRTERRLHFGGFSFDLVNLAAWNNGVQLTLSGQQFRALLTLARSIGRPVSRVHLSEAIWGGDSPESSNALDALICRLRKKLGDDAGLLVQAIYGIGYRLVVQNI